MTTTVQFLTSFLILLVSGVFWGPWLSLHRSIKVFSATEFVRLVKVLAKNLGAPMRFLMPVCVFFIAVSVWIYPQKDSYGFYFSIASLVFMLLSLLITVVVEVPIVNEIIRYEPERVPAGWESLRNRWLKFHVVRMITALLAFAAFDISLFI